MGRISLGSNISSLAAQRQLGKSSEALNSSAERLSSGLRINRASDDAAGLAISASLNTSSRVFAQGLRNINDGLSLYSIAEGAAQELSGILIRIKELAEQSANGTYSSTQRTALNSEAQSLRDEFNRIIQTTEFNDLKVLDGGVFNLQVQAGGNAASGYELNLGISAFALSNDGTFLARSTYSAGDAVRKTLSYDFTGDSKIDIVTASTTDGRLNVLFGNGDGSFRANISYVAGSGANWVSQGDFNRDGVQDLVSADVTDNTVNVLLGNSDGTFKAFTSYASSGDSSNVTAADVNGDGILDIVSTNNALAKLDILIGNGDGTFKARVSYVTLGTPFETDVADINGDGKVDLIGASNTAVPIFFGNGDGTFKAALSLVGGTGFNREVQTYDFNADDAIDIVSANSTDGVAYVISGNGNGTFKAAVSYVLGGFAHSITVGDVNGDGKADLIGAASTISGIGILFGNGDGTFSASITIPTGVSSGVRTTEIVDLNNDGVFDIVGGLESNDSVGIFLGNGVARLKGFNLLSRAASLSALEEMDVALSRVSQQLGRLGAQQSRLQTAANNLSQSRVNYISAESRITSVDVAEESATFVRLQILQQAGAAILAQANQTPALALQILKT